MPQIIQQDNVLFVITPFSRQFVDDLKAEIPASKRKWDGDKKTWIVDATELHLLRSIVEKTFGQVQVLNQIQFNQVAIKHYDKFLIEYLARTKSDGYALAFANNGFNVRFSEKVLRDFFVGGFGEPVAEAEHETIPSDYYKVLGVKVSATPNEIKTAWRRGVMTWHPDRNQEPDAREWFDAIQQAYNILKDQTLRTKYNAGRLLDRIEKSRERNQAEKFSIEKFGYVPPVRCGLVTFDAIPGVYLDVQKIYRWDDDTQEKFGVKLIRVASWDVKTKSIKTTWEIV